MIVKLLGRRSDESCTQIVNNLKPKVLAGFLGESIYVENPDKQGEIEEIKALEIIRKYCFIHYNEIVGKLSAFDTKVNRQVLDHLRERNRKYIEQKGTYKESKNSKADKMRSKLAELEKEEKRLFDQQKNFNKKGEYDEGMEERKGGFAKEMSDSKVNVLISKIEDIGMRLELGDLCEKEEGEELGQFKLKTATEELMGLTKAVKQSLIEIKSQAGGCFNKNLIEVLNSDVEQETPYKHSNAHLHAQDTIPTFPLLPKTDTVLGQQGIANKDQFKRLKKPTRFTPLSFTKRHNKTRPFDLSLDMFQPPNTEVRNRIINLTHCNTKKITKKKRKYKLQLLISNGVYKLVSFSKTQTTSLSDKLSFKLTSLDENLFSQ